MQMQRHTSRKVPQGKFLFQDFHEGTFMHVRAALGLSNEEFAASLEEVRRHRSWLAPENAWSSHILPTQTIEGNFSGGSSGAFMYFSKDRRFVVKTLTRVRSTDAVFVCGVWLCVYACVCRVSCLHCARPQRASRHLSCTAG